MHPVLLFVEFDPQFIQTVRCIALMVGNQVETKEAPYVYKEAKMWCELPMFRSGRSRQPMTWKTSRHHALYTSIHPTQLSPASIAALIFCGAGDAELNHSPFIAAFGKYHSSPRVLN